MSFRDARFLDFAAAVKNLIRVPVIAVGRLGDPAVATEAVAAGKADFIALGRALIAEPQWVEKLARAEPIRRCLACNTCINEKIGRHTSELQSPDHLVCRLLLEKKKKGNVSSRCAQGGVDIELKFGGS